MPLFGERGVHKKVPQTVAQTQQTQREENLAEPADVLDELEEIHDEVRLNVDPKDSHHGAQNCEKQGRAGFQIAAREPNEEAQRDLDWQHDKQYRGLDAEHSHIEEDVQLRHEYCENRASEGVEHPQEPEKLVFLPRRNRQSPIASDTRAYITTWNGYSR